MVQAADLVAPLDRGELIRVRPQLSHSGATRPGTAALVRKSDRPGHGTRHSDPERYADIGCTTGTSADGCDDRGQPSRDN